MLKACAVIVFVFLLAGIGAAVRHNATTEPTPRTNPTAEELLNQHPEIGQAAEASPEEVARRCGKPDRVLRHAKGKMGYRTETAALVYRRIPVVLILSRSVDDKTPKGREWVLDGPYLNADINDERRYDWPVIRQKMPCTTEWAQAYEAIDHFIDTH